MMVRVIVDKAGEGSNPLQVEDNYRCFKEFDINVYTSQQLDELINFIEAGVNAYEDWVNESYSIKE